MFFRNSNIHDQILCKIFICCLLVFRCLSILEGSNELPCVRFDFENSPLIRNNILTARENTTAYINFRLKNITCTNLHHFIIEIGVYNADYGRFTPHCFILNKEGKCHDSEDGDALCRCGSVDKSFNFTRTLRRSDTTKWEWSIVGGKAEAVILTFNVIYPGRVTNLTINGEAGPGLYIVQPNLSVPVLCTWENGNPPGLARLLDGKGTHFNSSNVSGVVGYEMQVVCYERVTVYCIVDDSVNVSAMILAKCPPKLSQILPNTGPPKLSQILPNTITATYSNNAAFKFQVQTHTSQMTSCRISRYSADQSSSNNSSTTVMFNSIHVCGLYGLGSPVHAFPTESNNVSYVFRANEENCRCVMNGTVPDLLLTVCLYDVKRKDSGLWQVFINNNFGEDHMDTFLQVTEGSPMFIKEPQYLSSAAIGHIFSVAFPVRAHTLNIIECLLTQCQGQLNGNELHISVRDDTSYSCDIAGLARRVQGNWDMNDSILHQRAKCQCAVNGSVPDLVLTLDIFGITKQDGGQWCLALSNHFGSSKVAFTLTVNDDGITWWHMLLFAASGIIGIAVIIGVCFIVKSKRRRCSSRWSERSFSGQVQCESSGPLTTSPVTADDGSVPQQPVKTLEGTAVLQESQQIVSQESSLEGSGVRLLCQGGDIMQVLLLVKGRSNNPETLQSLAPTELGNTNVLNYHPQYSALDPLLRINCQEDSSSVPVRQPDDYLIPCFHSYCTLPPRLNDQTDAAMASSDTGKEGAPTLSDADKLQPEEMSYLTPETKIIYGEEQHYVMID